MSGLGLTTEHALSFTAQHFIASKRIAFENWGKTINFWVMSTFFLCYTPAALVLSLLKVHIADIFFLQILYWETTYSFILFFRIGTTPVCYTFGSLAHAQYHKPDRWKTSEFKSYCVMRCFPRERWICCTPLSVVLQALRDTAHSKCTGWFVSFMLYLYTLHVYLSVPLPLKALHTCAQM